MSLKSRLAIDISIAPHPRNGIGVYARGLIKSLARLPEFSAWHALAIAAHDQQIDEYDLPPSVEVIRLPPPGKHKFGTLLAYQLHLPKLLASHNIAVYHAPGNAITPKSPTPPIWSYMGTTRVITIHDVIPILFPQVYLGSTWSRTVKVALFRLYIRMLTKQSSVITSSLSSANDLKVKIGVKPEQIHVIPIGVNEQLLSIKRSLDMLDSRLRDKQFLLHVGTGNQNKNVPSVLKAFTTVRKRMPETDLKLVLVGHYEDQKALNQYCAGYEPDILYLGNLSLEQLAQLYYHAAALIFPSFYEGFGLPPLEAMSMGCPVIVSNTSSMPEVTGDAAIHCHPTDIDCLSEAVISLVSNKTRADQLRYAGYIQASRFDWSNIAAATLQVYLAALKATS